MALRRDGGSLQRAALFAAILAAVLAVGLSAASAAAAPATLSVAPGPRAARIEPADCAAFEGLDTAGATVQCGYMVVPEQRANLSSREIKVAYAILKAQDAHPLPDPVVYLTGGPGDNAIRWIDFWAGMPMHRDRDIILVDPRGVGYSQPAMKCPPDTPPDAGAQDQPPPPEALLAQELRWAQACRDQLAGAGFDLTAYNSMAHASDLNDLRQALGYARWNLYGTSYGTRTALVTMQAVPEGIRSAVLDSVLPPQVDFIGRGDAAAAAGSLSALFAACKADAACNRDYPDLETKLGEVVRRLDANPAKVKAPEGDTGKTRQVWIAGANVLAGIRAAMMQPVLIQILPLAITRLHAGDPSVIERLYGALLSGDNPAVQNTVLCHDTGALFDAQAYHQELARLPLLASSRAGDQQAAVCQAWGAGRADPAESQPVRSDIPTLLLSGGGYDAGPAEGARLAASTLSRSFRYEFPAYSHYVTLNECPQAMMAAFLDDPSRAPDASCAAGIKALPFVTDVYLNPGVFRVASDVQFEPKAWIRVALALCGLLFLAAVIGAPILWLRSRRGAGGGARRGMAWLVLWLGALCSLAFGAGVWLLLRKAMAETYGWVTLFGFSPASSRYLFLLPWLAAVLAIAAIVFAVTAAVRGWWSRGVWIAYTAVTAAVLGFSALLVYWRLLGAVGFAY